MLITATLLRQHRACANQVARFEALYPDGCEPTVETLTELAAEGLDAWWLMRLLLAEGPGSRRAYALWCAEQVAHLCDDPRVAACLAVVRRRVLDPESVSDDELRDARAAADAAYAADAAAHAYYAYYADYAASYAADAYYAASYAARDAAYAADYAAAYAANAARDADYAADAAREAQLACLSHMLMEVPC